MKVPAPEDYMRMAIRLSKNGFPAPNPHVGCVIVKDGVVVGRGWHRYRGTDHAEVMALKEAGSKARGATAYVTLEPCNHTGLTGPCSEALLQAEIVGVVFACSDPDPSARGGGKRLQEAGVKVRSKMLEAEARAANAQFLFALEEHRARVVLKAAVSVDGFMGKPGEQIWLTGEESRRAAHRLRAECGSVLVGKRTVEVDDPQLTARIRGVVNQPIPIVLDPQASLKKDYRVFQRWEALRVTGPGYGGDIEVSLSHGTFDLLSLTQKLRDRRIGGVLVEGGPQTLDAFWRADLADRVELFVSPKELGEGIRWDAAAEMLEGRHRGLQLEQKRRLGPDLHLSFRRQCP
jgi:diaminohydroxyphosphoribosylaminopyrimidine deaminase / 5-amino-6-(5-phosphoribosylamino)uracil reductase